MTEYLTHASDVRALQWSKCVPVLKVRETMRTSRHDSTRGQKRISTRIYRPAGQRIDVLSFPAVDLCMIVFIPCS